MPKPVRPFPLISYYWEPSIGFRWKGTRYGIAGRVNPCAMSVETVRAVNEKGYDAVFAEQWKAELSECDIDPEAVSVDSEAHDMENGRDGLDGNAPEKDAPEKDDRDAQPSVDTDNR